VDPALKQHAFEFIDHSHDAMTALWAELVSHESPSADKNAVDGLARKIHAILAGSGAEARIV
jgi:hypothetical protein